MALLQGMQDVLNRGLDRHVKLAVTGLSRAGKTAFITSLVNQLLHTSTNSNLPLFSPVRDGRLIGAKRIAQTNLKLPRFAYESAISNLYKPEPSWPAPTVDVGSIKLALRFKPNRGLAQYVQDVATLYIEIIDYPGEWLLDLPLLDLTYLQWSELQMENLTGSRCTLAKSWLDRGAKLDPFALADEELLAQIASSYTNYLHACKDKAGLHWVQPGRFVLPGELAGAPILQFFPFMWLDKYSSASLKKAKKNTMFKMLEQRFNAYKKELVADFYKNYFTKFDRQIILVDCLQPLNKGPEVFADMRAAIGQLVQSFNYGRNSIVKRLFNPQIDKLLFAATKADHITPEQQQNLVSLLQQLVQNAWQTASFSGIKMECMTLASIAATKAGFIEQAGSTYPALRGLSIDGQELTIFPGEVPARLPDNDFWDQQGFAFKEFRPLVTPLDEPLAHIRMDKVLDFLLGDKLQ